MFCLTKSYILKWHTPFWMKNTESISPFSNAMFLLKKYISKNIKTTRCSSLKIALFDTILRSNDDFWCAHPYKRIAKTTFHFFENIWWWFWQCVYRGARIKNHHCCEELRQKVQFWLKNAESFWCFLKWVFFIKNIAFENGQIDSVFFIQNGVCYFKI